MVKQFVGKPSSSECIPDFIFNFFEVNNKLECIILAIQYTEC